MNDVRTKAPQEANEEEHHAQPGNRPGRGEDVELCRETRNPAGRQLCADASVQRREDHGDIVTEVLLLADERHHPGRARRRADDVRNSQRPGSGRHPRQLISHGAADRLGLVTQPWGAAFSYAASTFSLDKRR